MADLSGRLAGRVAVVTGASRGLGRDIAVALARAGANVVVSARTESEGDSRIAGSLQRTVEQVEAVGGTARARRCDVTSESDVDTLLRGTVEEFGRLDIVVNNAGILIPGAVTDLTPKRWDLIFRVNVLGPFLVCRAAVPLLADSGGGHIVNISSRGAIGPGSGPYEGPPRSGGAAYGATKAALERFTQGLALEVFDRRISVNALAPNISIWSEGGDFFRSAAGGADYSGWRMSGEIIGDATVVICRQEPGRFTGHITYDDTVMLAEGGLSADEVARRYPVEP